MNTFQENINKETKTIMHFIQSSDEVKLNRIQNEGFSRYDFSFTSANTKNTIHGICEAKTRTISSTKWGDGMLEMDKVNFMFQKICDLKNDEFTSEYNVQPFFLCKFTDATYIFNLNSVDLGRIEYKKCPQHTSSDGNNQMIWKPCLMFNIKDGQKIINTQF